MAARTHYQILGLSDDADFEQVKNAYRLAAKRLHPDRGGNAAQFQEATFAYEVLTDPQRRRIYDQWLTSQATRPTAGSGKASTANTAQTRRETGSTHTTTVNADSGSGSAFCGEPVATPLTHPSRRGSPHQTLRRRVTLRVLLSYEPVRMGLAGVAIVFALWQQHTPMRLPLFGTLGLRTVTSGWGYLTVFVTAVVVLNVLWLVTRFAVKPSDTRRWVGVVRRMSSWLVIAAAAPGLLGAMLVAVNFGAIAVAVGIVWVFAFADNDTETVNN